MLSESKRSPFFLDIGVVHRVFVLLHSNIRFKPEAGDK